MRAIALVAAAAALAPPSAEAAAARCGQTARGEPGFRVVFDGTRRCLARWEHTGGASMQLRRDGTLRSGTGPPGLGVLWYTHRRYRDFVLRLQFRDDAPQPGPRANSGVHLRFPAPRPGLAGCPADPSAAWVAINCGHEVQINDDPAGDPRKTGSIYGFAELDREASRPTRPGVWNDLAIRVVGQRYTVRRNGRVVNRFVNAGVPGAEARKRTGHIGLQAHGAAHDVVSFRNIRVRDVTRP